MQPPISDYALIGDCESAALVSRAGSIDWLCWPRFDSEACFARLLGRDEHGCWEIGPVAPVVRISRRYLEDTLVLETRFETDEGAVTLTDFMPVRDVDAPTSSIVRRLRCERGSVEMSMRLALRFGYGRIVPWVTRMGDGGLRAVAGPHAAVLRAPVALRGEDLQTHARFTLRQGETLPFTLTYEASHLPPPKPVDAEHALDGTVHFWRSWVARSRYRGPWTEAVNRSLITIKALIYQPTGGVVAAPTTSLPEEVGGERNWDYRYCWVRDATFTLLSLLNAGYREEAEAWCDWLLRAVAGVPSQLQPVYGLSGEPRVSEYTLAHLPGYRDSRPVRVGNAAYNQLQLDAFGSIMDTLHQARCAGLELHEAGRGLQSRLVRHLESLWQCPDEGIWEVRGDPQHFVHSKVMCWVTFDRAIAGVEQFGLKGPVDRWRTIRDKLHAEIIERGFNAKVGAFTQTYDSTRLDASALLMPLVGFLPPTDSRVMSTTLCIERELMRDGLVRRYRTEDGTDGLSGDEGTFLACSFWLLDNMMLQGREPEARALFERLLSLRNDVGLLAEQYDVASGMQVGNFPQAFSHFALIDSAFNFAGQRGEVCSSDT